MWNMEWRGLWLAQYTQQGERGQSSPTTDHSIHTHTHLTLKCVCVCVCLCVCVCVSGRAAGFIGTQPQFHLVKHLCAVSLQSLTGIQPLASSVSRGCVETALQLMRRVTDFFL